MPESIPIMYKVQLPKSLLHGVMTIQTMRGIINKSVLKEGTGYVLLNRLHAVGFKKRPGQGEAPTPRVT
ncbi:hypothetical protein Q2X70_004203 [Salmonella enterica]|nr:hypothetical protein [Salmonella enterica]EKE6392704.1 hypothetical protein [Salmonella enterica]ELM6820033.1 hypothetical protein [Salmonella enterica]ELV6918473.1 hypothetical protein [Salmonella enterica]